MSKRVNTGQWFTSRTFEIGTEEDPATPEEIQKAVAAGMAFKAQAEAQCGQTLESVLIPCGISIHMEDWFSDMEFGPWFDALMKELDVEVFD
jgi:hypothetical protein